MKTFVFVSIFTWNYASDSIRVHVSVTIIKYNTFLRDLGKLLGEVVKWFWPSTLHKTITRRSAGGPTDLVWAPVMSGSRLLRVTDRKNGVAVIRKRSKKKKNPSKYASRAIRKHRWRKKSPGSWDDFPGTIYRLTGCKHRTKISITLVIGFSWFLSALFKWWEMLLQTYMTISRIEIVFLRNGNSALAN